ncbi:hypothetical protein [Pseudomonas aeruginosa]|uniref:hypothetical protein n=1 Tax=Pseudomonas aeruginosa TaxID=287 RepID=UPI003BFBBF1E
MTVKPISDEELDVAERLSVSREVSATATWILNGTVSAIIARLRAAEADTKRLDWLSKKGAEEDPSQGDVRPYIDAAMERTP